MSRMTRPTRSERQVSRDSLQRGDQGAILIIALVLVTTLALLLTSLADYVQTSLRAERAWAAQAQRLAAADGALRLTVELLRQSSANCVTSIALPELNGATVTVRCGGNGLPGPTWTRHDLTATVQSADGAISVARATVQLSGQTVPCTASCTVTINAWLLE